MFSEAPFDSLEIGNAEIQSKNQYSNQVTWLQSPYPQPFHRAGAPFGSEFALSEPSHLSAFPHFRAQSQLVISFPPAIGRRSWEMAAVSLCVIVR